MPDDSRARNTITPPPLAGADYAAILATIAATERGRWFLDEYAARHRGTDTEQVLAAIARVEAAIAAHEAGNDSDRTPASGAVPPAAADTIWDELSAASAAVGSARQALIHQDGAASNLDASHLASVQDLLDRVDHHLTCAAELLGIGDSLAAEAVEPAQPVAASPRSDQVELPSEETSAAAEPDEALAFYREPAQRFAAAGGGLIAEPAVAAGPVMTEPVEPAPDHGLQSPAAATEMPPQAPPAHDQPVEPPNAETEAMVTDWAFDAAADANDDEAEPPAEPETDQWIEPATDAIERLEAREYGLGQQAAAAAEETANSPRVAEPSEPQPQSAVDLDELMLQDWSAPGGDAAASAQTDAIETLLSAEPAASETDPGRAPAESLLDIDLFETDRDTGAGSDHDPALPAELVEQPTAAEAEDRSLEAPAGAMADAPADALVESPPDAMTPQTAAEPPEEAFASPPPTSQPAATEPPPRQAAEAVQPQPGHRVDARRTAGPGGKDDPSVVDRLETMRRAIASLMAEIEDKTGRPVAPPSS